jgi:nicotinamide riboside kinase
MTFVVGFSGPSGAGKTTLVNDLLRLLLRGFNLKVKVIPEIARMVFQEWEVKGFNSLGDIREMDPINFQIEVLKKQVNAEFRASRNPKLDIVLVDRTIYDNLFFTICFNGRDWKGLEEYLRLFKLAERFVRYDLIFFCKALNRDVDDGFRTPDLEYRGFQEFVIRRLIPASIPTVEVDGSREERAHKCLGYITNLLCTDYEGN